MKYSIIIALIAIALLSSCTKSEPVHTQPAIQSERTVATDWMSMSFQSRTDENGNAYLQADRILDGINAADINNHHAFLYAVKSVGDPQIHKLVPFNITSDDQDLIVSYSFDSNSIAVRVDNATASGQAINADQFQVTKFQLILISEEDYNRLHVDWSDYSAVINAIRSLGLPDVHLDSDSPAHNNK
jgi:hypothetical protein